jgi:hypothetical protein
VIGMKRKMWNNSWHSIHFSSLNIQIKYFTRPSSKFYDVFYQELFLRYNSFESLSTDWKQRKLQVSDKILEKIGDNKLVLSVGCGLGFIEQNLVNNADNLAIDVFDFSESSFKLLREVKNVNILTSQSVMQEYNFIYCSQFFYALNDDEIDFFLTDIKKNLSATGIFCTIDKSINFIENGLSNKSYRKSFKVTLKNFLRPAYLFFFKKKSSQFWGWQRDNAELIKIFTRNNYEIIENFSHAKQSFLLFRKK